MPLRPQPTDKKYSGVRVTPVMHNKLVAFCQQRGMLLNFVVEKALTEYMAREHAK